LIVGVVFLGIRLTVTAVVVIAFKSHFLELLVYLADFSLEIVVNFVCVPVLIEVLFVKFAFSSVVGLVFSEGICFLEINSYLVVVLVCF
jgi:hypothetical protein